MTSSEPGMRLWSSSESTEGEGRSEVDEEDDGDPALRSELAIGVGHAAGGDRAGRCLRVRISAFPRLRVDCFPVGRLPRGPGLEDLAVVMVDSLR